MTAAPLPRLLDRDVVGYVDFVRDLRHMSARAASDLAALLADCLDALASHHSCTNLGCPFCALLSRAEGLFGGTAKEESTNEGI